MRLIGSTKLVAGLVSSLPHLGEYLCVFRVGGKVFQLSGVDHEVVEVFILLFLLEIAGEGVVWASSSRTGVFRMPCPAQPW